MDIWYDWEISRRSIGIYSKTPRSPPRILTNEDSHIDSHYNLNAQHLDWYSSLSVAQRWSMSDTTWNLLFHHEDEW